MINWKIYQEAHPSNADKPHPHGKFGPLVGVVTMTPDQVNAYLDKLREDTGICHSAEAI
jgi:hypothetical protein